MDEKEKYKTLLSEIIEKQAVILGPDIALLKARNVSQIVFSGDGKVVDVTGDPKEAVEKLVDEYIALSGQIVKSTLRSVFEKYSSASISEDAGSKNK